MQTRQRRPKSVCPESDHNPCDPRSQHPHVDIPVPVGRPESNPSTLSLANKSRSESSTSGKLWFQLPGFLSTMLAVGFLAVPAQTHVWSSPNLFLLLVNLYQQG